MNANQATGRESDARQRAGRSQYADQFQSTMPQVKEQMKAAGKDPCSLVLLQLRPLLARYARLFAPGLHVLSYNEVPDELELKIMGALM
ncbi:hypothetical protein ACLK14_01410 [Escherichia coli]